MPTILVGFLWVKPMEPVTEIFTVQIRLHWWAKPFLLAVNAPRAAFGFEVWVPDWAFSIGKIKQEAVNDGARQND
ncbi:hypothetical protein ACA087_00730 [Pseudomonas chlororaphis]|uniref:hypothetical protein n=1 Tax=Pseudomonas chlororaphis TaxID=587753 RepID=UPI00352A25AE